MVRLGSEEKETLKIRREKTGGKMCIARKNVVLLIGAGLFVVVLSSIILHISDPNTPFFPPPSPRLTHPIVIGNVQESAKRWALGCVNPNSWLRLATGAC